MQLEGQKPVTCFRKFGIVRYSFSRWYCLAGKMQHLRTIKHNKNFLNPLIELDHLEPEDELIETLLNMSLP